MIELKDFTISIPTDEHISFSQEIENLLKEAATEKSRGLNIKNSDYIAKKIKNGDAIIALHEGELAGFCYLRRRKQADYVSISGIVIIPKYRKSGLSNLIINEAFALARSKYPQAKIFSLTTSPTFMQANSKLGYKPVNYSKLSTSVEFWNACSDCLNYETLKANNYSRCLCTASLFNPYNFNIEDEYELNELSVDKAAKKNNRM